MTRRLALQTPPPPFHVCQISAWRPSASFHVLTPWPPSGLRHRSALVIRSSKYSRDAASKRKKRRSKTSIVDRHLCLRLVFREREILPTTTWGQCCTGACSGPSCRSARSPGFRGTSGVTILRTLSSLCSLGRPRGLALATVIPGRNITERFYRSLTCVGSLSHHEYPLCFYRAGN